MIKWLPKKSIFDHAQAVDLVCPVNCIGVMGAGLALEFKKRFDVERLYKRLCVKYSGYRLKPGYTKFSRAVNDTRPAIWLFATKDHWRDPSRLEWIEFGISYLAQNQDFLEREAVAFPKLGCGLGGLQWPDVRRVMIEYLEPIQVICYVHGENEQ
jgi:O-acetyl-ADP-ribose deacetylase (regulator of RNase III)